MDLGLYHMLFNRVHVRKPIHSMGAVMGQITQIKRMKQILYDDIVKAIDRQKVHVGEGLSRSDIVGIIDSAKFDFMFSNATEDDAE